MTGKLSSTVKQFRCLFSRNNRSGECDWYYRDLRSNCILHITFIDRDHRLTISRSTIHLHIHWKMFTRLGQVSNHAPLVSAIDVSLPSHRELAKKTLEMSGQFSTDNINLVKQKSPLGLSTRPVTTKAKMVDSSMDQDIERDGLRIPRKIDSTWAVSKVLLQKKGKVALKDLRRFNELSSENQRGLNRQRKVQLTAQEARRHARLFLGNHFPTRCQSYWRRRTTKQNTLANQGRLRSDITHGARKYSYQSTNLLGWILRSWFKETVLFNLYFSLWLDSYRTSHSWRGIPSRDSLLLRTANGSSPGHGQSTSDTLTSATYRVFLSFYRKSVLMLNSMCTWIISGWIVYKYSIDSLKLLEG